MNSLITVSNNKEINGKNNPTINARDLHKFLESKQNFADWIKNRIKQYGFVENQDFVTIHNSMKREIGGTIKIEYHITLNMAKELAMVERNEQGKKARQYFIKTEELLQNQSSLIVNNIKQELIPAITNTMYACMEKGLIKSNLTQLTVEKADNTVNALSYNRISHDEKKYIMEMIRSKCEKDRGKYFLLKNNLFNFYGVTTYVDLQKRDFKDIMCFIQKFKFSAEQLSFMKNQSKEVHYV